VLLQQVAQEAKKMRVIIHEQRPFPMEEAWRFSERALGSGIHRSERDAGKDLINHHQ
jgi:hypothetical protein